MTSIETIINGVNVGAAVKRLEITLDGPVGTWTLNVDNSAGASEIVAVNHSAVLGINGSTILNGYVDDILPEVSDPTAVFDKQAKIEGRNYGRDLARLHISKTFIQKKLGNLFHLALVEAGSEITCSQTDDGPLTDAQFTDTYLGEGFLDAAKKALWGFTVKNDKSLKLWELAEAEDSGVLLKAVAGAVDNNILLINPEGRIGFSICNEVKINGGKLKDHLTEGNAAALVGVNATLTDETELQTAGKLSIKATLTVDNQSPEIHWQFPLYDYSELDYSNITRDNCTIWCLHNTPTFPFGQPINKAIKIFIKDSEGVELSWQVQNNTWTNVWTKHEFILGTEAPIETGEVTGNWKGSSEFNWHIVDMWVQFVNIYINEATNGYLVWVDGLELPAINVYAIAQDAASIATFGHSMIPISRPDLKSQSALQEVADLELENRKDPFFKLSLTCTFQPDLLYTGYLVDVLVPAAYIGSGVTPVKYRLTKIIHIAEPGVDLCRGADAISVLEMIRDDEGVSVDSTRIRLASAPQDAINVSYDNRLRLLEGNAVGLGAFVGGGVGGGVDWWSVPYIRVHGDAYFLGDVSLSQKLTLVDPDGSENFIDVNVIMLEDPAFPGIFNPFLEISEGIFGHKDIVSYGGFLGSSSAAGVTGGGCVQIGTRFEHADDPPRINLTDSGTYLAITAGSTFDGETYDLESVLAGLKCDTIYVDNLKKVNGDPWDFAGSTDKTFNSILLTEPTYAALKIGLADGTTYVGLGRDGKLATYGRDLYFGTEEGYKVEVQRNLKVGGTLLVLSELVAGGSGTSTIGLRRVGANGEVKSDAGYLVLNATGGIVQSVCPFLTADLSVTDTATFIDPDGSENFIEMYVKMVQDPLFPAVYNPFLYIDQGLWVLKDVYANGYLGSASPVGGTGGGCLMLGENFEHTSDPPRINLTGSDVYVAITKGSTIGGGSWDLDAVLAGLRCAGISVKGNVLPIGDEKDLGSTTYPWNDVISLYAHIGNVTVSNNLYVNAINTVTEANLAVNLNEGYKMVVNGDLEVTGSFAGGSSIKRGSSSTNSSGVATVTFASAFAGTPYITVTPVDAGGRSISIVITAQSASAFSVKATVIGSHTHNLGVAWATASFGLAVASDGSHDHTVSVDSHSHTIGSHTHAMGTAEETSAFSMGISSENAHTHAFGTLGAGQYAATPGYLYFHELGLGGQTCGLTVATASYGPHASLNTGGGSSHTHTLTSAPNYYRGLTLGGVGCGSLLHSTESEAQTLTTGSGSGNTGNAAPSGSTNSAGSHTHTLSNKPGYARQVSLRGSDGELYSIGTTLETTTKTQTDLYTASASVANAEVSFNWIAVA